MSDMYLVVNMNTRKIDAIFFSCEKKDLKEYLESDKSPNHYEVIVSENNFITSLSKILES
jgi:hypothetical protein